MRRRLLVIYLTLLAAAVTGLTVPLAIAVAGRDTQAMFIDRQADTERLASLAEPALRTGHVELLSAEVRRYQQLFGIAVVIVRRDGRPVLVAPDGLQLSGRLLAEAETALSGGRTAPADVMWPWREDPLIVAEPVRGGAARSSVRR